MLSILLLGYSDEMSVRNELKPALIACLGVAVPSPL